MSQETHRRKKEAIASAESSGDVADSMDYRLVLMEKVKSGEITLQQAQSQLKVTKRKAGSSGKTTRAKVYRQS